MGKIVDINRDQNSPANGTELSKLLRVKSDSVEPVDMEKILEFAMEKAADMEYELFQKGLRKNAVPPIRGEITEEKIKKRGITRCYNKSTGESWLEQEGKRITEIFRIVWK